MKIKSSQCESSAQPSPGGSQLTAVTSVSRHLDESLGLLLDLREEAKDINDTSWWKDFVDGDFCRICRWSSSRYVEFRNPKQVWAR